MTLQPDALIDREIAERYRIDALIARGGMARVYRARDTRLERDVAVKVLSQPYADDPEFTTRFLAEARAAGSMSHPSLVHVYDSGSDGDEHFIVMELLDRHRSLREELELRGRLQPAEVLRIGQELLAGLRVVHDHGFVHCDVKPANVMLGPGPAKLIDFGIARAPDAPPEGETSIGSLRFMSPEQLHGERLTPASDLFSLGVVLYEALAGRPPFEASTPEDLSRAHAAGAVRPASTLVDAVPGRLDEALLQALRREPEQRFHSAEAMSRALRAAEHEVSAARDQTTVVHRVVPPPEPMHPAERRGGYVPPPVPHERPAHPPEPPPQRPPPPPPARRPVSRGGGVPWGALGTLLILGAAAAVVIFVVIPLLREGGGFAPGAGPSVSATALPATPDADGVVVVPNVVGMSAEDAVAAARSIGLDWTVHCDHDESQPEGIIHQEPPAGNEVRVGSPFSIYSARLPDCQRQY